MKDNGNLAWQPERISPAAALAAIRELFHRQKLWRAERPHQLRFVLLALVVAAMFYRVPNVFLHPRFWAEEGACFFTTAYRLAHTGQWYLGLFKTMPIGGYVDLWTCIATTAAANLVSEEHAPRVTLAFALLAQLIPFAIVLWSCSALWRTPQRRALGVLILLFAPLSGEAWLNTLHSKAHFAIATSLLLIADTPTTALVRWAYRLLLGVAGLSGPTSCILAPLFCMEAYFEKRKERTVQAAILATCAAVQAALVLCFGPPRTGSDPTTIFGLTLWTQCLGPMVFGYHNTLDAALRVDSLVKQGGVLASAMALLSFSTAAALVAALAKNVCWRNRRILVVGSFLSIFASVCGAVGEKTALLSTGCGARYFLAGNVGLLLLMLAAMYGASRFGRWCAGVLLTIALAWGFVDYRDTASYSGSWANWKSEVRAWRHNPQHQPRIWPDDWICTLDRPLPR